jgi:hypothetical protein
MAQRRGPRPPRLAVGAILTGVVLGEAKRGVLVELGAVELVLPRSRYGAAADRIEGASYGAALTVEVVADPSGPGGVGLSRVGIERSVRQPRAIDGRLRRQGAGIELVPADGGDPFEVVLLDRAEPEVAAGAEGTWSVGAPYRGRRFVVADLDGP